MFNFKIVYSIFNKFFSILFLLILTSSKLVAKNNIDPMLLKSYANQDLNGWVMSEKFDGVRGIWDGSKLYSRQGYAFNPPSDFLQNFPDFALDGELFSRRDDFENISSIVKASDYRWNELKLLVFDVPNAEGDLFQRLQKLKDFLQNHPKANKSIAIIDQIKIRDRSQVIDFLHKVESMGGEGLVLRDPNSSYEHGRSNNILKLKSIYDDECTVVKIFAGKGKYNNMMGALGCKNELGFFKIGTGFSDKIRSNPPAIGTVITYKYRGLTKNGKPRFASFYRIRSDK